MTKKRNLTLGERLSVLFFKTKYIEPLLFDKIIESLTKSPKKWERMTYRTPYGYGTTTCLSLKGGNLRIYSNGVSRFSIYGFVMTKKQTGILDEALCLILHAGYEEALINKL